VAGARGPVVQRPGRGQFGNLIVPLLIEPSMRALAVVLVAGLLAGCAERGSIGSGPDAPVTGSPAPGPSVPSPAALEVTPRPGLVDVRPQAWDRAEVVGPRRVRVEFYGGVEECEGLDHIEVDETVRRVTIALFVGRVPEAQVCIEIAVLKSVTIEVEEPVGDRELVDGFEGNLTLPLLH
jgi:hypothetical protein